MDQNFGASGQELKIIKWSFIVGITIFSLILGVWVFAANPEEWGSVVMVLFILGGIDFLIFVLSISFVVLRYLFKQTWFWVLLVIAAMIITPLLLSPSEPSSSSPTPPRVVAPKVVTPAKPAPRYYSDYDYDSDDYITSDNWDCTDDCSGHEAGYDWAADKGITDPDDCGGNSNSFIEGCEAYANEYQEDQEDYYDDYDYYNY